MVLENWAGMIIFIIGLALMFLLVPKEKIREFLFVGLITGLALAFVLVLIMQNMFGFWVFNKVDFIYILNVPLFLSAAWTPIVIAFSELMTTTRSMAMKTGIIIAVPIAAVIIHYLLIQNQMLIYSKWNYLGTFIISLVIHLGIYGYLYLAHRLAKERTYD